MVSDTLGGLLPILFAYPWVFAVLLPTANGPCKRKCGWMLTHSVIRVPRNSHSLYRASHEHYIWFEVRLFLPYFLLWLFLLALDPGIKASSVFQILEMAYSFQEFTSFVFLCVFCFLIRYFSVIIRSVCQSFVTSYNLIRRRKVRHDLLKIKVSSHYSSESFLLAYRL